MRPFLLALAAMTLSACGGGSSEALEGVDESKPLLRADGPLGPVVLRGGSQLTSNDTEVNAVVTLGEDVSEDAELAIAWFRRRGGDGRKHLFTHELTVGPVGRARSQGVARNGIEPGVYETVATLGERQTRTVWIVTEGGATRALSVQTASTTEPAAGASTFEDGWGDELSGTPPPPPEDDGPCEITTMDVHGAVTLQTSATWTNRCTSLTFALAVTGQPRPIFSGLRPEGTRGTTIEAGYCDADIPGASDLPGTVVRGVVSDAGGASANGRTALPDLGEFLQTSFERIVPPPGRRVRPGDTISVDAVALVFAPALGIRAIYVNANDELVEAGRNLSGSTSPRSCDPGRLFATLTTSYRVPAGAPGEIEICANAVGFDDTKAEECATYYTGEVWEGEWDAGFHVIGTCTPPVWPQVGTVSFTVAGDGSISGTGDLVNHTGVCGGVDVPRQVPVKPQFSGRRTEAGFDLQVQLPGLGQRTIPLRRTGDVAEGGLTVPLGGGSRWEIRTRLECKTCGAPG